MENKEIRFIDSHYNELFRIPDGGQITINYPDGHKEYRTCKYIDDYHFYADNVCFHICQFAEIMEANRKIYAPKDKYELEHISVDEFEFMFKAKDTSNDRGCIGYVRADFGNDIEFHSSWFGENEELKTDLFKKELTEVIDYFREKSATPLLKSRSDMSNICYTMKATSFNNGIYDISAFKITTDKHTYYLKCNPRKGDYDLYCYCYNNQQFEKYKNLQFVENNIVEMNKDKFFVGENSITEVYYNPDADSGGNLVYNEITFDQIRHSARAGRNLSGFFANFDSRSTQYLIDIDTPEFKANAYSFINRKADFEDRNEQSFKKMKKISGLTPQRSHRSENFER